MRILTFLHSFEPGGVERVALRLVRRWRDTGTDALLFMGRTDGALRQELAEDLAFDSPARRSWAAPFETPWMIIHLIGEIRRTRPDALFCAGNTYTVVAVFMKLLLGRSCPPILVKVSNDLVRADLKPFAHYWHGRWAWLQGRLLEGWVIMHPAMRGEASAALSRDRLTAIPDPALTAEQLTHLRRWSPRAGGATGRRFVAMGRLAEQKNYPLMLAAFAAGSAPGDVLTIFGEGPCRCELECLVADLGLTGRVIFAGHVPDSADSLLDHDILLLSSAYEGVPAVLVEGLACGMPIVATDCGAGVRGLLAVRPDATLVSVDDPAAFARAIAAPPPSEIPPSFDANAYTIEAGAGAYLAAFATLLGRAPRLVAVPTQVPVSAAAHSANLLEDREVA